MHIIKISPSGFKIILTKEDLQNRGVENMLESSDFTGEFFADIIEETNRIYGNPFTEGAIDAEFFASKDGGGELFLCSSSRVFKKTTYLYRTENLEDLIFLCRNMTHKKLSPESKLFYDSGRYDLLLFFEKRDDLFVSFIREFGKVSEISKLQTWLIEEHEKLLLRRDAVSKLSDYFKNPNDTPL